jgi:hypothetical protein
VPTTQQLTGFSILVKSGLPASVKRLSLFEDISEDVIAPYSMSPRLLTTILSITLAERSRRLQQLSASFMFDALCFFRACQTDWVWAELRSLAVTSRTLDQRERVRTGITDVIPRAAGLMLCDAARAVKSMPKLKIMEIWNGGAGHACLFRYQIEHETARLTWKAAPYFPLDNQVVKVWKGAAGAHSRLSARINCHGLPAGETQSHGDAIHHFGLEVQAGPGSGVAEACSDGGIDTPLKWFSSGCWRLSRAE